MFMVEHKPSRKTKNCIYFENNKILSLVVVQCPASRVFQYWVRSGRAVNKIPGSRSGLGRVGASKYMIGYFRVSFLLSGISGYLGYFWVCRVFSGISGFT